MSDFFDDEFSAYDIDGRKAKDVKATTTDNETGISPVEEPTLPEIVDKGEEEPLPQELNDGEEDEEVEEEENSPSQEEEDRKANDEEARRVIEKRQAELEARHQSMSLGGKKTLGREDIEQMIVQQEENVNDANTLLEKVMRMSDSNIGKRKPKGLIVTKQQLEKVAYVFKATKALLELYVEMDIPLLYESLDEYNICSLATNTQRQLKAHMPTMQEGLDSIAAMDENFDRPAANLRMRIIKGQTFVILSEATNQAKALAQTMESFPMENGSLLLQCLIAEKGDDDNMTALDNTLMIAGTAQVLTKDALAMTEALKKKDMNTICSLQKNLIDYQTKLKA